MLTVADELTFDALDESTRKLCDKIIDARIESEVDESLKAARVSWKETMDSEVAEVTDDRDTAWGVVKALELQLEHFGIKPNRQFAETPEKPKRTIDPADLAAVRKRNDGDDFPRPMGATPRD
jgi:hypothetical protein